MLLSGLLMSEKRRLLDRLNEQVAVEQARREKLLASLSFDELAVYRVAVVKALIDRHGHDTEVDAVPNRAPDPTRKARVEQVMRRIEQANNRFAELESHGRIPAIVERLEQLALLPVV